MTPHKYPAALRALHWLIALLILGLIAVGWYMAGLPDDAPGKFAFYPWHKSFGVLILLLVTLRLTIRWRSLIPELPAALSRFEAGAARWSHRLLYLLMFLVPLSGYTMSSAGGHPINFFGLEFAGLIPKNKPLAEFAHEAHEILAFTLLGLVLVHAAAAIKHRVVDRARGGDVLERML